MRLSKVVTRYEKSLAGVIHIPNSGSRTGVVICHGMMSSKDSPKHIGIAERLAQRGHMVLRFDFSGRGESAGDLIGLTVSRQVHECRSAIDVLMQHGVHQVALVGSSLGGAVTILAAAQGGVFALATMAAVARLDLLPVRAVGLSGLSKWRSQGFVEVEGQQIGYSLVEDTEHINVLSAASRVQCPWLILHGVQDEVIPKSDAELLYQASGFGASLELIPDANHRFSKEAHRRDITNRIVSFIDQALLSIFRVMQDH